MRQIFPAWLEFFSLFFGEFFYRQKLPPLEWLEIRTGV
jgi:hypothetical protein